MKTFTTYAEKKAKQILNLLQGYTKGIRVTAILILLLMGVSNAWAEKGFFGEGQWNIEYWDGSYDGWGNSYNNASNFDLGIKTTLYLKNGWVKTWSNDNWTQSEVIWYWGWTSGSTTNNWKAYKNGEKGDLTWNFDITDYDLIGNAPNNPGHNTLYMYWRLDNYVSSSTSTVTFTIPGFTSTNKSKTFSSTMVGSNSSQTISFGTHYGTALTTNNCIITGTNKSEFSVTSINESGVTVQFKPTSAGNKTATLTITDAHSKKCTITLSGTATPPTYTVAGSGAVLGSNWDQSDTNNDMTLSSGTIYTLTKYDVSLTKGINYECKVVQNHNWDNAWPNNNYSFTVPTTGHYDVTFTFDSSDQSIEVTTTRLYAVIYDGNGKTSGTVPATTYHKSGSTITVANNSGNLAKSGYTFEGWNENADGTGTSYAVGSTFSMLSADKILYAKWTANKYTVKFHKNGGEGAMDDQDFTYDIEQELTENAFTLENALFVGWATSEENAKNGTVAYTNSQSVSNLTTTKDGVVNLYAVWATISITACPERIKLNDQLTLTISYKNIPENYIYRVYITNHNQPVPNNNGEWITISGSGTLTHASQSGHNFNIGENNIVVELYNQNHSILLLTSEAKTFIAEQIYNIAVYYNTGNGNIEYKNITGVSETFGATVSAQDIITEKGIVGYRFTNWSIINGTIEFDPNINSETVTITTTTGGQIIAHFEELQPKTIYLKTVEGTTDGDKWFVVYGGQEYEMTSLGCTNEYYKGEVPEGTSFHFVSKDNNDTPVETKGTDLQYVEGKTLYNLVSAAASGNKIFFNPNTNWLSTNWNNDPSYEGQTPRFAALFDGNTWLDMTDNNDDKIFECVKPSGATRVYFCRMKPNTIANSWSEKWQQTDEQTIPNGKNLFTLPANASLSDWARGGTWSEFADTPVNGDGEWTTFTGITYRITFDQQEATTAGTTHVDVAYHASMPEIEKLPTKTEKKFGGYYTQANGQGVMLVNAFGEWQNETGYISSTTWEREECVTLYAYWKELTPEITDVTLNAEIFEPVDENQERFVTAEPTIDEHNNTTLTYVVCWKLLYTNGREVEGYDAIDADGNEGNSIKFSIAGLSTGTYTIRASLRTGGDCNSGEEISRFDKQFSIVANRIVTVNYTCDGREIMASTKQNAHVINATSITAPDIVGYTFKAWVAGDGVIISTANKASKTIEFTAYYDGYLTATYTKNDNIIYFYNTLGWQNVYVYFYNGDYWDASKGSGAQTGGTYQGYAKMTQIAETNIWYVNASGKSTNYLVFGKENQDSYQYFHNTEVVRRGDYNKAIPMFVPIKAAEENKNGTKYYNKGYWMNYPENTGYKLQIYDKVGDGAKEVASVRFPYSTNTIMPLTVSVDLEAGKTYGFKILREDNTYFGNNSTITTNITNWSFETDKNNCGLQTTLAGDYTFTLKYADSDNNKDYKYRVDVVYPVSVGDYRVIYKDNAKWSQTAAHGNNWYHPSYAIKKNSSAEVKTDIVSFFIAKDNNPTMKFQKCTAINGQTVTWTDVANGTITIPDDVVTAAGVYNFIVKQPAGGESISVESVEPYTGNYYIRVDAMDGKWGNYKTNPANRMTYSAFSENRSKNKFGELFSHYATKWCEEGTNVKFTIANDYSPCISDTLIQDNGNPFNNINEHGNLTSNSGKNAANIRFMWNRHTNKISRAYVAGATFTDRQFLILKADKEIKNASGGNLSNDGDNHSANQAIFSDTQNWIYERTIQVQPSTRVKLYACYPTTDVANAQYFRGTYDNNNAIWNDANSVQILGGTGDSWNTIRIIYDFKTNRLMAAWIPTGEIDGEKSLQADMMILREHQEDAACITFANSAEDKLINVQTVYGVLRFNRWVLNNRKATGGHEALDVKDQKTIYERALYFISFPFNVHLSDVFGFGTYGTHWVISEYNGKRRAERGYFADNCVNEDCTNWDYIWDPSNVTLEANKGYLLSLDLDLMKHDNTSFWAHDINTVELCFPSYEHVQTIQQTNYTMSALGTEYECKINHNTPDGDRRVKDSYWRCIGVPSFADYNNALTTDGTNTITWKPKGNEFPFLYEWNVSDNSLMVCAASQYKFRPTFAYLVQNGNEIHWSAVNATPPQTSIAARQRTDVERNYEWKITLSRDDNQEDQTFLRMTDNEEVTAEFDFGQDLSKELNYGRSDIYTLIGYERAAANSMPLSDSTTVVPLGLDIEQAGDYTIAMPEGVESVGVTLLDAETGERTNLSMGMDYTISLNKGVCHNRLYLEISPIQQTPTDIEYTDQGTREQSVRKVLIDGKLYIVCDGVVYDAQGKRM